MEGNMRLSEIIIIATVFCLSLACGGCATVHTDSDNAPSDRQTADCSDFPAVFVGTYTGTWDSSGTCGSGTETKSVDRCGRVSGFVDGQFGRSYIVRQSVSIAGKTCGTTDNGSNSCGQIDAKTGDWSGTWQNGACSGSYQGSKQAATR